MFELPPPEDDGLYIPEVGDWSWDKHHFLMRYIDAFTTSMREKPWESIHYIDLFAGAGIERLGTSKRLDWGSILIAAQAPYSFDGLHACELDQQRYDALQVRLSRIRPNAQVLHEDANDKVHEIVADIPQGSLSLAFLDPHGLHLDFETLRTLARRRSDLIIFFPDRLDALRNWQAYYFDNPDSNLDRVLGPGADWRALRDNTPPHRWAQGLRKLYEKQISSLGYRHFEYERISTGGHPLYLLIFCSRSHVGAKIWRGIALRKPDNQQTFDFGAPDWRSTGARLTFGMTATIWDLGLPVM